MSKKLKAIYVVVLCAVLILTMAFVGCKTTTAAETTTAAAETAAAAETTTAAAEAAEQTGYEDISIWFDTGGPEGCPFGSVVYNGAKAAEKDLGCKVTYVFSNWDAQTMIENFKLALAADPDGICIMGHPGIEAYGPLIDEAEKKGIIVTSQNSDLKSIQEKYVANGFGYVGQDLYGSGVTLGKTAVSKWDLKAGDKALVWGWLSQGTRGLRTKGCIDGLEAAGLKVDYIEISKEGQADPSIDVPSIAAWFASNPDAKVFLADGGGNTVVVRNIMDAAKLKPGDVKVGGFDLSPATAEAIKLGYVGFVLDQQPFLQGYLPILQVCLTKKYNFVGLNIDTGGGIVDATNIDLLSDLAGKGIR
ncbi:MAG: sugar ABC transporter substrate-binding protein [Candidatus Humimicrobiaceae bacterium]